jgi:hypothetical protein
MPISPCNNLNVKTIRFSQLAQANLPLGDNDVLNISQYSGGVFYSKKASMSDIKNYIQLTPVSSAYTASYLLKTSVNNSNFLTSFDSYGLKSTSDLKLYNYASNWRILQFSSSTSRNDVVINTYDISSIQLYNLRRVGVDGTYPNVDGIIYNVSNSGSFNLIIPSGSYQLHNSGIEAGSTGDEVYVMSHRRNCLFFWPYMTTNAASRDGGIGIGVQPPNSPTGSANQYLKAKFQINMFSGSNEGSFPGGCSGIENKQVAILVNYGSGSAGYLAKFYVSSSGNTYVGGKLTVNQGITGSFSGSHFGNLISKNIKATGSFSGSGYGRFIGKNSLITGSFRGLNNISNFRNTGKSVSFNGTSSYSVFGVTSSYAVTSSYSSANDRVPVFGRFFSDLTSLTVSSSTFTTSPVTITMPTGYSTWDEFDLDAIVGVDDNTNGGNIAGQLKYGDGVDLTISSTAGSGNYNQKYLLNNSDDNIVAKWRHMGIVGSSYNSGATLSYKLYLDITGVSVNSVCLLLKAYAKK